MKEPNQPIQKPIPLKILLSGGGTGGHIFPAIAIADEIKRRLPNTEFLFIGANGKMEMEKVPKAGYVIKSLDIAGINRGNIFSNFGLIFKIIQSFRKASKIIKNFKPNLAIGTGGFASGPALFAAQKNGVISYLQEQNAYAGITNKILSKKAKTIFSAYPNIKGLPAEKTKFLGNPVRDVILNGMITQHEAKTKLGLNPNKICVLSVGGSLGSKTLNLAWEKNLESITQNQIQLIWQTGKNDIESLKKLQTENIRVEEFITDMPLVYSAADIIVSRAGAIAISELAIAQKPIILVPFPYAAEDHQTVNAKNLVDKKAAIMIPDQEMNNRFLDELLKLCKDENLKKEMRENLKFFAKPNATKAIVDEILKDFN